MESLKTPFGDSLLLFSDRRTEETVGPQVPPML